MALEILRRRLMARRMAELDAALSAYAHTTSAGEVVRMQVAAFNAVWSAARARFRFYRYWQASNALPDYIVSPNELAKFPAISKADLQPFAAEIFAESGARLRVTTGGSTGEPATFPADARDLDANYIRAHVGRGWYGIQPCDRMSMVWGHSHLFGGGWRGWARRYWRRMKDGMVNITRLSAYDLAPSSLERHGRSLVQSRPRVVYGYTSALTSIARHWLLNHPEGSLGNPQLRVIIATSETIAGADRELLQRAFGSSVASEYGLAEAGPVAHSHPSDGNLRVFIRSFLITQPEDGLLLTTLERRAFPLINYATGDTALVNEDHDGSILSISRIKGREHDMVTINTSVGHRVVHGEMFTHILKAIPGVNRFQVRQRIDGSVIISILPAPGASLGRIAESFHRELCKEVPDHDLNQMSFAACEDIPATTSGKARWIIVENQP